MRADEIEQVAAGILASFGTSQVLELPSAHHAGFGMDEGYRVAHAVHRQRLARGEALAGRKIGGTNRSTYHISGAKGPSWGFMYDTTVSALPEGRGSFSVGAFPLSRIEPEIALHLSRTPEPGMSEDDLIGCIDRVTHGFEFVFSPFGRWGAPPQDSVAAFCLHQGFVAGPWREIGADQGKWRDMLRAFSITLSNGAGVERHGAGSDVFGSPILALKSMVDEIGAHPDRLPMQAGEIVTTGTITELMPAVPGETWTTTLTGIPLAGLTVQLT